MTIQWDNILTSKSKAYTCGYCGKSLASEKCYLGSSPSGVTWQIYICHHCSRPTFFENSNQTPGSAYGKPVNDLPAEVKSLYDEARNCVSVKSFTASVLCSRKLLMNIAVSKGADEGKHFFDYVEYLENNNYIPPDGKDWVDHIRTKGNEATHEIAIMKKEDAEELIDFIEMLLKFIYEFPGVIKRRTMQKSP